MTFRTRWNLPPGVTDRMIDEAVGSPIDECEPMTPEEEKAEAWEYWNGRAMAAEYHLHAIAQLELASPATEFDSNLLSADEANKLLGEVFRLARLGLSQ